MARHELRDARGALLGWIDSDGSVDTLRDYRGALKGTYNARHNETRDYRGALVARGNVLARLL